MTLLHLVYLLVGALVVGMTGAAVPPIVRGLPDAFGGRLVRGWVEAGVKPWACDLCMSVWSTCAATGLWWMWGLSPIAGVPAFVVTYAIVRFNSEHIGPPPGLPELEDSALTQMRPPPEFELNTARER